MTILKYLDDTYLFECESMFIEMKEHEKGKAVILNETIFYPQGGGQPADKGEIISGDTVFVVNDVRLDEDGTVWHFGEYANGVFNKGDKVLLKIDKERRILHAKLHSAGHLLDCAVSLLGLEQLHPVKGFHFPDGPYVEYDGMIDDPASLLPVLQKHIDDLLSRDVKLEKMDLSCEEAQSKGIHAPPGKSARVVHFEGFSTNACGCGGTHVNHASEIGKMTVRKIKSSQGKTKMSYSVE